MIRILAKFVLTLFGWKTDGSLPEGIHKAVVISAPHTSNWDFVIGRLTFFAIRVNIRFLIKEEVFTFPAGWFMKRLGGIPVERDTANRSVDQVVKLFRDQESLIVVITPEGARKRVDRWKKGFYLIAQRANVPIALAYINYQTRTGGIGPVFMPSGDYEKDLQFIHEFYRDIIARHPERFNLSSEG